MGRFVLFSFFLCHLVGCHEDTVTKRYPTLADATADRLFERGWLPNVLPSSTRDLVITTDLDTNTADGAFRFNALDRPAFVAVLERTPIEEIDEWDLIKFLERDYQALHHKDNDQCWIFFVHYERGYCEFRLHPKNELR